VRVLYVTGFIVVVDQVSKLLVKGGFTLPIVGYLPGMEIGTSIPILGDFFKLTFIENPGMAFGIDVGGKFFLTIFSTLASAGILYYLFKIREEALVVRVSLAMILGGAIGNLIDRVFYGVMFGDGSLFYGKVVDFFDVDFFKIDVAGFHISRWPIFNVADAAVSVGVVLLLIFHRKFTAVEDHSVVLAANAVQASEARTAGDSSSDLHKESSSNSSS
jgi:signal peptidase II